MANSKTLAENNRCVQMENACLSMVLSLCVCVSVSVYKKTMCLKIQLPHNLHKSQQNVI